MSAWAACITGHAPPISASAINNAPSAFIRRSCRIAPASSLLTAAASPWSVRSDAKCCSGFARNNRRNRSGSRAVKSQRYGELSAREATSVPITGRSENRLLRDLESADGTLSSQSDTRSLAVSGSLNRGAVVIRSASAASLAAAALLDLRASFLGGALRLAGRLIRKSVPALPAARQ